ncbi:hypothetical protein PtA15_17A2 [Puccinia triticina]|uniref:Uncharacterized protein n=1 Tax=Puccinia triticina TaxID=208348 RepID=A0ABY7D544_9BASI|nr:uncharacterized protein PtA15_17A2 [Puccinia triticina]WAQ92521.1 hypothetical protein PtA15_17A2 [Puccinia triticina]
MASKRAELAQSAAQCRAWVVSQTSFDRDITIKWRLGEIDRSTFTSPPRVYSINLPSAQLRWVSQNLSSIASYESVPSDSNCVISIKRLIFQLTQSNPSQLLAQIVSPRLDSIVLSLLKQIFPYHFDMTGSVFPPSDGFVLPGKRRSARLANASPARDQNKSTSPTARKAEAYRNTPRDDMQLNTNVAESSVPVKATSNAPTTKDVPMQDVDSAPAPSGVLPSNGRSDISEVPMQDVSDLPGIREGPAPPPASDDMGSTGGGSGRAASSFPASGEISLDTSTLTPKSGPGLMEQLGVGALTAAGIKFGRDMVGDLSADANVLLDFLQNEVEVPPQSALDSLPPGEDMDAEDVTKALERLDHYASLDPDQRAHWFASASQSASLSQSLSGSNPGSGPIHLTPLANHVPLARHVLGDGLPGTPADISSLVSDNSVSHNSGEGSSVSRAQSVPHARGPVNLFIPKAQLTVIRFHKPPNCPSSQPSPDASLSQVQSKNLGLPDLTPELSVDSMKALRAIWVKNRDGMVECNASLVASHLDDKVPEMFLKNEASVRVIDCFIKRLDEQVAGALEAGQNKVTIIEISDGSGDKDEVERVRPLYHRLRAKSVAPGATKRRRVASGQDTDGAGRPAPKRRTILPAALEGVPPRFAGENNATLAQIEAEKRRQEQLKNQRIVSEHNATPPVPYDDSAPAYEDPLARAKRIAARNHRRLPAARSSAAENQSDSAPQSSHSAPQGPEDDAARPGFDLEGQDPAGSVENSQEPATVPPKLPAATGKGKKKAAPRVTMAGMTKEQKAEHRRKKEVENAAKEYKEPPHAGVLLAQIWSYDEIHRSMEAHQVMMDKSKNTRWDIGPEIMGKATQGLSLVNTPDFRYCIIKASRLFQFDANNPFWHKSVVNFELIEKGFVSEEQGKAAAWKTLGAMVVREGTSFGYTADKSTQAALENATRKIHMLGESCLQQYQKFICLEESETNTPNAVQDSFHKAGLFIIGKLRCMESSTQSTAGHSNSKKGNGFMILQKRIWELLLCILLMQQSRFKFILEQYTRTHTRKDVVLELSSKMTEYDRGRSLFNHGDLDPATATENEMKE